MKLDWKVLLGLGITAFLLWFIFRGEDFGEIWTHVRQAHVGLLLASVAVSTAGFLIRAWRWKVLLEPVLPNSSLRNRFAAVNIGFMANNLLPARVGEVARAYALTKVEPISMSAALGSLVVERLLDGVVLIGILVVTVMSPAFPASAQLTEGPLEKGLDAFVVLLGVLVLVLTLLLAMPRQVVRFSGRVAARLPGDLERPVVRALEAFLGSLGVLRNPRLLVAALLWSIGFWLWHGLSFWLGMLAFDIHAGLLAAYFTEAVVAFVVAVPATPGFFGTFHYGVNWALGVFSVPAASTLAYAIGYHLGGFIPVTLIGLYYAGRIGLSLKEIGSSGARVEGKVEPEPPTSARVQPPRAGEPSLAAPRSDVPTVRVDAPAKVNLALHVGPRRQDGYHDLETLFQAVDLCDVIEVRREGSGVELTVTGADLGPPEENLAVRAARAYLVAARLTADASAGVVIRLEKRIPAAAGLGGGSSDAAATLKALDRLFDGAVGAPDLVVIAASLGSDVPFFLARTPLAVGRGRGELLEAFDPLPSRPGLVVMPGGGVSTAGAYRALDQERVTRLVGEAPRLSAPRGWSDVAARAHNDFERVVAAAHPGVREALAALRGTKPMLALLCGSGAACFALYDSDRDAENAHRVLSGRQGWVTFRTRTLAAWPEPAQP